MTDVLVIYENENCEQVADLLDYGNLCVKFVDWTKNEVYVLVRGDWRSA